MLLLLAQATDSGESGLTESLFSLEQFKEFLTNQAGEIGLRLVAALAIFLVGRVVVRILAGLAERAMTRAKFEKILVGFTGNVVHAGLLIVVVMAALSTLGINLTSLTAMLAAAGFAVGMALQGSLSNFAAGILLVVLKPFRVGDFVETAGVMGTIEEIHLFSCTMRTFDNIRLTVPNGEITSNVISNYTSEPTRLITMVIGCGYDDDLRAVKSLLTEIVTSNEKILDDPEPLIAVDELGDSSVNFVVRPWVKNEDYWSVKRSLTEQIKLQFDENGFTIPYPSRDVYLHEEAVSS